MAEPTFWGKWMSSTNSLLWRVSLAATVSALAAFTAGAGELERLKGMSLDELAAVEVTTASRVARPMEETPAAVFVITRDDIRRSGADNVPELLRMVPGLHVAQINNSTYVVASRGFSQRHVDKLLVMKDGRTLYTPLFAGVYWDVQDTVLQDIERIEVIRGPGAAIWGANAVNGVINIITRSARETEGNLAALRVGSGEDAEVVLRHGGAGPDGFSYRVFAKGFEHGEGVLPNGVDANDGWRDRRAGFRVDGTLAGGDALMLQGELYRDEAGRDLVGMSDLGRNRGANLMARWSRERSDGSGFNLQAYYDRTERKNSSLCQIRDTYDLDFQHHFPLGERQRLIWGAGYRVTDDENLTPPGSAVTLNPTTRSDELLSLFVQDEVELADERLWLTLGAKYEHNDYTGDEWMPNLRLLWKVSPGQILWGAVTHAVRSPSRMESDMRVSAGPVTVMGNPAMRSETLTAYELGWRGRLSGDLTMDATLFHNDYDDLRSSELVAVVVPNIFYRNDNRIVAESNGLELSATWDVSPDWRLALGYSWFDIDAEAAPWTTDPFRLAETDYTPEHQLSLRSSHQWGPALAFNWALNVQGETPAAGLPGFERLDVNVGWRPTPELTLRVGVDNLLDRRHVEFVRATNEELVVGEVERRFFAQLEWRH